MKMYQGGILAADSYLDEVGGDVRFTVLVAASFRSSNVGRSFTISTDNVEIKLAAATSKSFSGRLLDGDATLFAADINFYKY